MGLGGISIWQLLIILVIVVLLFGSGKLRTLGADLGSAIKGFRKGIREGDEAAVSEEPDQPENTQKPQDKDAG